MHQEVFMLERADAFPASYHSPTHGLQEGCEVNVCIAPIFIILHILYTQSHFWNCCWNYMEWIKVNQCWASEKSLFWLFWSKNSVRLSLSGAILQQYAPANNIGCVSIKGPASCESICNVSQTPWQRKKKKFPGFKWSADYVALKSKMFESLPFQLRLSGHVTCPWALPGQSRISNGPLQSSQPVLLLSTREPPASSKQLICHISSNN